ncbi:type VI secretion system-associated protein TagF [Candidatus Methylomicrobium oryzae]|uniref:type VI secretion system-associated protein TagF n=1 Tax=Candidatus Methylomicrobium oryzae TaxID=2802053 RepID=UPI0019243F8B|nr:type VI secretion system-associated protein TagF [Methylomicrobium sp. RS1]MBL1265364.1 type VI secretion system-associated protein TagF [Methylomicrobium sp. RS1]
MSAESVNILGYYGKVPTHGDFVTRGLPRSFIEPWDLWLQEAILTSRRQLGENWLNHYLTSPLYHFALSPGICGNSGWMGVLMPSVDRIGRYYPMTIALMNNAEISPFVAMQKTAWFSQIEEIALSCLKDGYDLDEFNQAIDRLGQTIGPIPADCLPLTERHDRTPFLAVWRQPLNSLDALNGLIPPFLDRVLRERCLAYSLWWTEGSEQIPSSFLFSEGLPPVESVAAMFDGDWQKWGWGENHSSSQSSGTLSSP